MNKIDENIEQGIEAIENWVSALDDEGYRTDTELRYMNGKFYSFQISIRQKSEDEDDDD